MRRLFLTITDSMVGRTVYSLLKGELKLSSGLIARCKQIDGGITLDGMNVHTNIRVCSGQILGVSIGETLIPSGSPPYEILFEDEDILIINKPAGAAAHGSRYDDSIESIEHRITAYFGSAQAFHPVSRLDRGTTGIMTIAKNGYMHERLIESLHSNSFIRTYIGIVHGSIPEKKGHINLPIGRADGSAIKRIVRADGADAKTNYEVIKEINGLSLVRFVLETGRTHQIRVHMSAIGHPLAGDWLYGTEEPELISRPALHSSTLEFIHPLTYKKIRISCEMPEDMRKLIY